MTKFFSIVLNLLMVFLLSSGAYAEATKARTAMVGNGIDSCVGIGDLSSGYTAEVDSSGNLTVEIASGDTALAVDSNGAASVKEAHRKLASFKSTDAQVGTAAGYVYGVTVSGSTAADGLLLYNAASATGTPVIDVTLAANTTTTFFIPGGVSFASDIYADLVGTGTATIYYALD